MNMNRHYRTTLYSHPFLTSAMGVRLIPSYAAAIAVK